MNSMTPQTCVFASTSRNAPVHLFDAYDGSIRASYRGYDHYDELSAALCVSFNVDGDRLYAGYPRMIRIFDVGRPGRQIEDRPTCAKRSDKGCQRGMLSCIAFNPDASGMYAVGSYDRSVWLYDDRSGKPILSFENAHRGGVTQVQWCPDGTKLVSGGRRDDAIVVWDIRGGTNNALFTFKRDAETNQKFSFDISEDGKYLVTGSSRRRVDVHDLILGPEEEEVEMMEMVEGTKKRRSGRDQEDQEDKVRFPDAVNGVALGRSNAKGLMVTCTGQRRQQTTRDSSEEEDDDDEDEDDEEKRRGNCVELWSIQ